MQVSPARVTQQQRQVAMVSEMFHTSSLLHDDVIDRAETRRGKQAANMKVGLIMTITIVDITVDACSGGQPPVFTLVSTSWR